MYPSDKLSQIGKQALATLTKRQKKQQRQAATRVRKKAKK
jgi:hypothetical protein